MQLVEQHIIKPNNSFYKECNELCFKSKNLYNSCLYMIRQAYIKDQTNILPNLHHLFKDTEQYKDLPSKVSSTVLLMVQQNFKSFFKSLYEFKKNPTKFKSRPRLPGYLNPLTGRFVTSYTNQAISKKVFKKTGKIYLSKTNIEIDTKITDFNQINCIRIIPRLGYYVIEVVYTIKDNIILDDNKRYAAIDLGVRNLATITSNIIDPLIISGNPLKSMNQFYNKRLAHYKSLLEIRNDKKSSKRIHKLNLKRKNKIDNYLHKTSKIIITNLKENKINTLVVGKNINWKDKTNIGSKNNQNFVNIPHSRFISMLTYKCEIEGINIITNEESYTSKASFLNLDFIPTYGKKDREGTKFSGVRNRGLYKTKDGWMINSDINGSYNILRKAIPTVFTNGIEGIGVYPKIIKILK